MLFLVVINTIFVVLALGSERLRDPAKLALLAFWGMATCPVLLPQLGEPVRSIAGWTGQSLLLGAIALGFMLGRPGGEMTPRHA